MIGIICAWFNIVICVGVPTAVFAFLLKKSKQSLKIFLVGGCTYLISQVCIRQPVLSILESIDAYKIFEISNPVGYMLFISITAALIEEFGRYIAFHFVTRDCTVNNIPLYYGFGHGGIEALSVGINNIFLILFSSDYLASTGASVALAGVERISTQIAQIEFSFIVFYAFHKKKYRYLMLAIVLHTVYDFSVILLNYGLSPSVLEMLLFVVSIVLLLFTMKYKKGVFQNEENC